jgi:NAD(P)-dependent dehydrogenase (short-subunit alcohol dehydrogenase family)
MFILFNNAGGGSEGPVTEIGEETWNRMTNLNMKSVFFGCKHVIPAMNKNGGGVILSTASILADVAMDKVPSYSAAKAGVIGLTRQIASEYGPKIRANCISPGWVYTATVQETIERSGATYEEACREAARVIPLGRFGRPEEAANLALFMVSDESSFITGAVVNIDGGYTIR